MTTRNDVDVVVVGAGMSGLYALYRLRELGLTTRVFEAGSDVGGTWHWNRYPGARCDVPSLEYSYSFSRELQDEWRWSEAMAAQPEILEYLHHVADRFDLRRDISFETRVEAAAFDETAGCWQVRTDGGETVTARFCIFATGCLSVPLVPEIPGLDSFAGECVHTGHYPPEGLDLAGRRVAVIGSGSSGVQATTAIAEEAGHLYVLQRTPAYTFRVRNAPITDAAHEFVRHNAEEFRQRQRESMAGFSAIGLPDGADAGLGGLGTMNPDAKIVEASPEERRRVAAELGFLSFFQWGDWATSMAANAVARDLYRELVHDVVSDPAVADALSPSDYPMLCKRPILDTGFYDVFDRPNVTLVDLRANPIEEVTPTGIRTRAEHLDVDVIVLATGFDAMTGALERVDIRGRRGETLREHWAAGPRTYLGLQVAGFPNLFTVTGPGSPSVLSNMVVSIEQHVDWISDCLGHLQEGGYSTIEATLEAEDRWVDHVNEVAGLSEIRTHPSCTSWYLGVNVPGKPRVFMPYMGGVGNYRSRCEKIAADGYRGFELR